MTIVITGSSSGIGYLAAKLFAKSGYMVYGISRSKTGAKFMKEFQADVSDRTELKKVFSQIYAEAGCIDVLIANAGIGLASPAEATLPADAERLFNVNFFGVVNCVRCCLPRMKECGNGRIIIVSSMAGVFPLPFVSFYSASKAALIAYAASLYNEAKPHGVNVSAVLPGGVRTRFTAKRKTYANMYGNPLFTGYRQAVESLAHEEQTGISRAQVAGDIYRLSAMKNPPALRISGGVYHIYDFMKRIVPFNRAVIRVLRKRYMRV